jgi:hypothetical protein
LVDVRHRDEMVFRQARALFVLAVVCKRDIVISSIPMNLIAPKSFACVQDGVQIAFKEEFRLFRICFNDASLKDHRSTGGLKHSTLKPTIKTQVLLRAAHHGIHPSKNLSKSDSNEAE